MRKLGRKITHRKMMLRSLVTSVVLYEKARTTLAKAKEARAIIERAVEIGKKGDLNSRRSLLNIFTHKNAVKKTIEDLSKRFKNKQGGYVQIFKLNNRAGDNSKMALIQFSLPLDLQHEKHESDPKSKLANAELSEGKNKEKISLNKKESHE